MLLAFELLEKRSCWRSMDASRACGGFLGISREKDRGMTCNNTMADAAIQDVAHFLFSIASNSVREMSIQVYVRSRASGLHSPRQFSRSVFHTTRQTTPLLPEPRLRLSFIHSSSPIRAQLGPATSGAHLDLGYQYAERDPQKMEGQRGSGRWDIFWGASYLPRLPSRCARSATGWLVFECCGCEG